AGIVVVTLGQGAVVGGGVGAHVEGDLAPGRASGDAGGDKREREPRDGIVQIYAGVDAGEQVTPIRRGVCGAVAAVSLRLRLFVRLVTVLGSEEFDGVA